MGECEKMVWAAAFAAQSCAGGDSHTCAHAAELAVTRLREAAASPHRGYLFPSIDEWQAEGHERAAKW